MSNWLAVNDTGSTTDSVAKLDPTQTATDTQPITTQDGANLDNTAADSDDQPEATDLAWLWWVGCTIALVLLFALAFRRRKQQ